MNTLTTTLTWTPEATKPNNSDYKLIATAGGEWDLGCWEAYKGLWIDIDGQPLIGPSNDRTIAYWADVKVPS